MRGDDHGQHHRPIPDGQIRASSFTGASANDLDERLFERLVDESNSSSAAITTPMAARDADPGHQKCSPCTTDATTDSIDAASRPTAIARWSMRSGFSGSSTLATR